MGYPLLKLGCIKALEPAWRPWTSAAEGNITEAVKKDMALTMAYDCLFGVAGRIDVLRQPTFASFLLSLVGSAGFEMGIRAWEAIRLRRKALKAVGNAADWRMKSGVSLHVTAEPRAGGIQTAEILKTGQNLIKHPSELDLSISQKGFGWHNGPRIVPKRTDVEPLGAAEEGKVEMPLFQIHNLPLNLKAERDLSGDPMALIEKPAAMVPVYLPQTATQPASANIMSVSVLVKLWGAHRLAETAANAIFRLQAFFVMLFFISLAPESRHACFGYVNYGELSKRVAVSTVIDVVSSVAGLAIEERLTLVRYLEIMNWVPPIPWCAYAMIIMLATAGGGGPMLAVDAGLFGENDCLQRR
ncbi:hypothetical protein HK104_000638 [Borealophlyctis nickersoniae]|nr:hypothetical protein HK104_000638 [Borealophlyctis nickersoniae]